MRYRRAIELSSPIVSTKRNERSFRFHSQTGTIVCLPSLYYLLLRVSLNIRLLALSPRNNSKTRFSPRCQSFKRRIEQRCFEFARNHATFDRSVRHLPRIENGSAWIGVRIVGSSRFASFEAIEMQISGRLESRRERTNSLKDIGSRGAERDVDTGFLGTALASHPPTSRQGHRIHHYRHGSRSCIRVRVRALIYVEAISVSPTFSLSVSQSASRRYTLVRARSLTHTGSRTVALALAFPLRSTPSRRTRSNGLHALHGHACTEPRFDACMQLR